MRRIVIWAMSTVTVLVLLFSYSTSRSSVVATAETRPVGSATSKAAARATPGAPTTAAAPSPATKTYSGDAVDTRFGPVQVQIIVAGGTITAVDVLQVPMSDRHDQMINSQAVPIYNDETVRAQSASIDVVSGATYTWQGYTQSLQSAIDAAHL
ncbi:MAG: FMN-binding protein [Humibacillus sp.]